ncbi:hypothetical protein VZG28_14515 (plasmid) [Synechococcus elongatus IITB4]|uniref:hypothetical protein n=1 Tax=Synechococcus elongatus TaxID=32046 RepID=UPI0030D608CC
MLNADRREGLLPPLRAVLTLSLSVGVIFRSYEPQDITIPLFGCPVPFVPETKAGLFDAAYNAFWLAAVVAFSIVLLEWDSQRIGRNRRAEAAERDAEKSERENLRDILQIQHQVAPTSETKEALMAFLVVLQGEDPQLLTGETESLVDEDDE